MLEQTKRTFITRLAALLHRIEKSAHQADLAGFATKPKGLVLEPPFKLRNPDRIYLGDDVKLGHDSVLTATTTAPGSWLSHPEGRHVSQRFDAQIHIGNRVTATSALQVIAHERITIEDDVLFASNVFVCDGLHSYERGDIPYKFQGIFHVAPIHIGRGSWVGQNVVVMPGVTIGELAIIGANSVVTKDVPAQTIATGVPARVTRRWDQAQDAWVSAASTEA